MAEVRCLFAFEHPVRSPTTCVSHRHSCTEIVFNIGGAGTLYHGDASFEYGPHSVFTYQPGAEHYVTQHREGIHFCLGVEGCGASNIRVGSFPVDAQLAGFTRESRDALACGKRSRLELISGLVALCLSERYPLTQTESLPHKARAIIDRRYNKPISMSEVAQELFISADYLRQLFRKEFGEGPMRYLMRKRIAAATELLRFSTLPIQNIARQCGFENPFYFSRQFHKMSGKPPSAVRPKRK